MQTPKTPRHHMIVENCDWSKVIQVRQEGATWDSLKTQTGLPALGMAIREDSPVAVQILLESGSPVQPQLLFNGEVWSPLWAALTKGNADILDLLLQAGASPDEPHPQSAHRPLDIAAMQADGASTIVLCKRGARPNTNTTPSPLWLWVNHLALKKDKQGVWRFLDARPVLALINAGARVERKETDHMGVDSLSLAKRKWTAHPLSESDQQHVKLVLSSLERISLMETAEHKKNRRDNTVSRL